MSDSAASTSTTSPACTTTCGASRQRPKIVNGLLRPATVDKIDNRVHEITRFKEHYMDGAEYVLVAYGASALGHSPGQVAAARGADRGDRAADPVALSSAPGPRGSAHGQGGAGGGDEHGPGAAPGAGRDGRALQAGVPGRFDGCSSPPQHPADHPRQLQEGMAVHDYIRQRFSACGARAAASSSTAARWTAWAWIKTWSWSRGHRLFGISRLRGFPRLHTLRDGTALPPGSS